MRDINDFSMGNKKQKQEDTLPLISFPGNAATYGPEDCGVNHMVTDEGYGEFRQRQSLPAINASSEAMPTKKGKVGE
jgi:hypothetical protein